MNCARGRLRLETWEGVMPRVRQIPDYGLAKSVMFVAECRSLDTLSAACRRAIRQFTGYPTFGLYWLSGGAPQLFASAGIPDGFDDDYRSGLGKCLTASTTAASRAFSSENSCAK